MLAMDQLRYLLWILIWVIIGLILIWATHARGADDKCMSQTQARAVWPNDHLWKSRGCWSNERKSRRSKKTPAPAARVERETKKPKPEVQVVRWDEENEIDRQAKPLPPPAAQQPYVMYPPLLMNGIGISADMLRGDAMTHWPPMIDLDEVTK